jgi:RNA polymerase sigma-70 factor (ECF subfamily)
MQAVRKGVVEQNKLPAKSERDRFTQIFRFYYPRLVAYGELFLDKESVRDIVQDLMVYIWDHADTLEIRTSLESYLFKSVYLRCLNRIKQEKVQQGYRQQEMVQFSDHEASYYNPDQNETILKIFSTELRQEIDEAINELPPKCKEAFIDSYIHEMSTREIAEKLNISERTVESHVYHALKHLRIKLKDKLYLLLPLFLGI